jgi:hypothetical protein
MRRPLEIVTVDVTEVSTRCPDALATIRDGSGLAGMVIQNVFSPETMEAVVHRLLLGRCSIPSKASAYYPGRVFGRVLPGESDAALGDYFREAAMFRDASRALFDGLATDFQTRLEELLQMMSGGRPVRLATSSQGKVYQAYSIREMLPGGEVGLHYENEAFDSESMAELKSMCPRPHVTSVYLALQVPEKGGVLTLYSLGEDDPETPALKDMPRTDERTLARIEEFSIPHELVTRPGDMLLFDAGRYYHRVTRVEGTRPRWTLGSFVFITRDGVTCYFA